LSLITETYLKPAEWGGAVRPEVASGGVARPAEWGGAVLLEERVLRREAFAAGMERRGGTG
jgi:hypothetical protein